jgi:hypothetical protein
MCNEKIQFAGLNSLLGGFVRSRHREERVHGVESSTSLSIRKMLAGPCGLPHRSCCQGSWLWWIPVAGVLRDRQLLVLVLIVALTCPGEWVTVADVSRHWSAFDGLGRPTEGLVMRSVLGQWFSSEIVEYEPCVAFHRIDGIDG